MTDWKIIEKSNGDYIVSNDGRIKSFKRKKEIIIHPTIDKNGYKIVTLMMNNERCTLKVHRIVAMAFIPNTHNKPQINHINGIKDDNRVENLEWVTNQENSALANSKQIIQFDKNGNFIKIWNSASECGLHGYNRSSVSACCSKPKRNKSHKGFAWKFRIQPNK